MATAPVLPEPTQDERTFATLAHALQMAGSWIAPLVIFFYKSESRFVRFHALQALLLQICQIIFMVVFMLGFFTIMISSFAAIPAHPNQQAPPPPLMFAFFPIFWLGWMGWWIFTLVLTIMYSIKAGRGQWARYPVLGRLAARLLGLHL